MKMFDSHKQYLKFSDFVMRKARHLLDEQNQSFVQAVVETSKKRLASIEKELILWRAQLGLTSELITMPKSLSLVPTTSVVETVEVEMPTPLASKRMVPLQDRAGEGRVNPKGIPCLYLSTDRDTAMTEVRPWIGSGISVAQFIILRDLKVVDCSVNDGPRIIYDTEPTPEKREERVWWDINSAFSEPVARSDDIAEYAPTQILAEAFRSAGYDGVMYSSKLGEGKTIALFDLSSAELVNCEGYRVTSMKLEFSHAASMYYAEQYYDSEDGEVRDPTSPEYKRKRAATARAAEIAEINEYLVNHFKRDTT